MKQTNPAVAKFCRHALKKSLCYRPTRVQIKIWIQIFLSNFQTFWVLYKSIGVYQFSDFISVVLAIFSFFVFLVVTHTPGASLFEPVYYQFVSIHFFWIFCIIIVNPPFISILMEIVWKHAYFFNAHLKGGLKRGYSVLKSTYCYWHVKTNIMSSLFVTCYLLLNKPDDHFHINPYFYYKLDIQVCTLKEVILFWKVQILLLTCKNQHNELSVCDMLPFVE